MKEKIRNVHPAKTAAAIGIAVFSLLLLFCASRAQSNAPSADGVFNEGVDGQEYSIIIHPDHFVSAAEDFAALHQMHAGLQTITVSISQLRSASLATHLRIPFQGYDSHGLSKPDIRGYDFDLAKRIISFLRKMEKSHRIRAVLILGDGALVPPSYYFYVPYLNTLNVPDKRYNEWIASDLLYGSPDFDLSHEWAVGRISVDTVEQARKVAQKYRTWLSEREKLEAPHPFLYFAGNIREDMVYSGELLYLLLQQKSIVGKGDKHYFESDGRFTIGHLSDSFRQQPASIHYIFSHGSGDGFEIDGEYLYSHEIAGMSYKQGLPLVVSSSCLDGGFDYDLIDVPHDRDGYSIGEAILRSEGAGIGYLGSSRVSLGQFHYSMNEGYIDPEYIYYRYMPGLLMDFFAAYHDGFHRIGDAYIEAHRRYKKRFGTTESRDFATFVELNLLADPVMSLPPPPERKVFFEHLMLLSEHSISRRMPLVPLHRPVTFGLHEDSPHDSVLVAVVDVKKGHKIGHARVERNKHLVFSLAYAGTFLIRLEFDDGSISWQYFRSG